MKRRDALPVDARLRRTTRLATAVFMLCAMLALATLCACTSENDARSAVSVPERTSVDEYSWSELSVLSDAIAAADGNEASLDVAKRFHLVGSDGTLDGSQGKWVTLADGTVTRVVIAGFNHDDKAGGGKAGITFAFADAVALRGMNNNAGFNDVSESDDFDAVGGWNASELRGWLNGEFVHELPPDLQAVLADVVKSSLVVPERELSLDDAGALLASTDALIGQGTNKLWIPAIAELSGVKDNSPTAKSYPEWTAPLKAEGNQYRLFADADVSERYGNAVLVRTLAGGDGAALSWWLRGVEEWTFAQVLPDGSIDRRDQVPAASTPQGIVPFFAL